MSIITQVNNTKFRSMKYGGDRLNGGSSNQPYIQTPIPDKSPGTDGPDFMLRGGLLTPGRIAKDVSRITQMFFDTRSLNGLLFTAKQNVLSLTDVDTNAGSTSVVNKLLDLNKKLYLPISTIAQTALTPFGTHLSKQGIIPISLVGVKSFLSNSLEGDTSRLTNLYDKHIINNSQGDTLYSYVGGPGSVLGIGTTNIKLSKDRTGINNKTYKPFSVFELFNIKVASNDYRKLNITSTDDKQAHLGPSTIYELRSNDKDNRVGASTIYGDYVKNKNVFRKDFDQEGKSIKTYDTKPGDILNTPNIYNSTLSYDQIRNVGNKTTLLDHSVGDDFRTQVTGSVLYSNSIDYKTKGINGTQGRINFNVHKPETKSYTSIQPAHDFINSKDVYHSDKVTQDLNTVNDLVKFRIAVIDNNSPSMANFIHFRAYIDSFSDSYSSQWNDVNYVGRGEKFYRYSGFSREISLSWTVVAQSKAELAPMYRKLNYLASSLAPDYYPNGYMRGNMVKLTIGGYLHEQPGIITSITYDVPQESTWEIGLGDNSASQNELINVNGTSNSKEDYTVKELPHMIKITNVRFIPIHTFVPQKFHPGSDQTEQRYIALSNGPGTNDLYHIDKTRLPESISGYKSN